MRFPTARLFVLCIILLSSGRPSFAQNVASILKEGDDLALVQHDNKKALEKYQKAEALAPEEYTVLWRLSRVFVDIAEHQPANTDDQKNAQLAMYEKSLHYADKAVKARPNGMMGYLRRAVANGRIALFKGVFSAIGLVKDVKSDVEKAIKLNDEDKHHLGIAYYLLARAHDKVCEKPYLVRLPLGLGWGDRDDAATAYEKAISLDPNFIMFRLDAARNYIEMDEFSKARSQLTALQKLPIIDEDDEQCKKEAAKLFVKIKDE
jgi:tetratricopeptide (TPR) repeat protein